MSLNILSFQPASALDVDILVGFMGELYEHDGIPFEPAIAHSALSSLVEHPDWGEAWLIMQGDRPAGYIVLTLGYSLEYGGRDAFIDELYVIPSERGKGIGTKALDFLRDRCIVLQVKALHLEVERENTRAQSIYRKAGFTSHERILMTQWI